MKQLRIKIDDRLYDTLKTHCGYNHLKVGQYVIKCIEKELYTDKYGDLNNIMKSPVTDNAEIGKAEVGKNTLGGINDKTEEETKRIFDKNISNKYTDNNAENKQTVVKRILKR